MSISRWENDSRRPTASFLLKLGMLAKTDDCWFFWSLAGLTTADVMRVLPQIEKRFESLARIQTVAAGAESKSVGASLVALPLLPLVAAATKEKGSASTELHSASPEAMLAAPALWCPNPAFTLCLRVKGDSMEPVLQNGYIIAVDQKQKDKSKLEGQIVVVHHDEFGLVVSRYRELNGSGALFPDNRTHPPVAMLKGWRVIGKVLWWIGQPGTDEASAITRLQGKRLKG
jgi:SOS-response transcriptional repressor LexA